MPPKLTDIETKSFYQKMLSQIREQRIQNQSRIINAILFIILISSIGGWLWWKRQNRLSKEEKERQHKEFEKYLGEKVSSFVKPHNDDVQSTFSLLEKFNGTSSSNLITNLPSYESEFELVHTYKSV